MKSNAGGGEDETRSVRSEFDYATKRKFVDIVKTNPNKSKLNSVALESLNGGQENKS